MKPKVAVLPGDGVGPEVTAAALSVLMAENDGLPPLLSRAVAAATRRSRELAGGAAASIPPSARSGASGQERRTQQIL